MSSAMLDQQYSEYDLLSKYVKVSDIFCKHDIENDSNSTAPSLFSTNAHTLKDTNLSIPKIAVHSQIHPQYHRLPFVYQAFFDPHNTNKTLRYYLNQCIAELKSIRKYYQLLLKRISLLRIRKGQLIELDKHLNKEKKAAELRRKNTIERRSLWNECARLRHESLINAQNRAAQIRNSSEIGCMAARKKNYHERIEAAIKQRVESVQANQFIKNEKEKDYQRRLALHTRALCERNYRRDEFTEKQANRLKQHHQNFENDCERVMEKINELIPDIEKAENQELILLNYNKKLQENLNQDCCIL